ncbi:uncharacterized protein TNCV_1401491 [Trichonephila clavipes]|nr:uncharacterized protein TNCV_1401491 [Trichonephila clavipes]
MAYYYGTTHLDVTNCVSVDWKTFREFFGFSPIDRTCAHYSAITDDKLFTATSVVKMWVPQLLESNYFLRGGFVGHRSRASSKHLSSHLPVDGVRFLGGQKGVALQLQDARMGVGSNKDADRSRASEK